MSGSAPNYYELLGVEPDAGSDSLKRAYRRCAVALHPDRNPGDAEAVEGFRAASEAYAVLRDPYLRTRYNCLIAGDVGISEADQDERSRERERAFERNRELHVELNRLEMLEELYDESVRGALRVELLAAVATIVTVSVAYYLSADAGVRQGGEASGVSSMDLIAWGAPFVPVALLVLAVVRHRSLSASRRLVRTARTDCSHRLASATLKARFGS